MGRNASWIGLWLALFAWGCQTDPDPTPTPDDAGAQADGAAGDSGSGDMRPGDQGVDPDDGVPADGAVPTDQGPLDPDMAVPPIDTCEAACARYATCERLDVWGDEGACLAACARADAGQDLAPWFQCLRVEACGLIQLCRLPAPPALTCDEVCAAADACGAALPFDDCPADCAALANSGALRTCGERLTGACDTAGFTACLGETVFTDCGARCGRTVACGVERADRCLAECVQTAADPDPLRRLRQSEANACVRLARDDCPRVAACLDPQVAPGVTQAEVCVRYRACGFEDFFPCDEIVNGIFGGEPPPPGFLACAFQSLAVCPPDPFLILDQCLDGGAPVGPTCLDLCTDQAACGVLPGGAGDAFACSQACNQALRGGRSVAARMAAQVACAPAASCDDLDGCLAAANPANACGALCDALDACGAAPAGCAARCEAEAFNDRWQVAFLCQAEAGDACDALAACAPGEALACDVYCDAQAACGLVNRDPESCLSDCDNLDFQEPAVYRSRLACALTAPGCEDPFGGHSVRACVVNGSVGGQACLGACRARLQCADEADLAACLVACGDGALGVEATGELLAGEACLAADAQAACGALDACLPDGAPDCAAWCAPLAACGLSPADCEATCAADPLSTLRARTQTACLAAAGDDCDAAAACTLSADGAAPPVDTSLANFCGLYRACGLGIEIPCEEFYSIVVDQGAGDAPVACMVREMQAQCPGFEFDLFEQCFDGGRQADPRRARCDGLCALRGLCGGLGEDTLRTCRAECGQVFGLPGNAPEPAVRRAAAALACADALTCDALTACVAESDPATQCARFCDARAACDPALDRGACVAACDGRFDRLRDTAWRGCVADAGGACDAIDACTPPPAPDCTGWCRVGAACRLTDGDCEARCDDADYEDPQGFALRLACARLDVPCNDDGVDGVSMAACYVGDPLDVLGTACPSYCRAVTTCDPAAERTPEACVLACALGFGDAEGLTFGAAQACFAQVGAQAPCAPLRACLPEAPPAIDCAAHCAATAACGVPDEAGCLAACDAGDVTRDSAGCVLDAERARAGCAAVAACVGFEPPPAPPACEALCARQAACGGALDPFVCALACAAEPGAAGVRAACAEVTVCGQLNACLDLPADPNPACAAPCAATTACGGWPDAARCLDACTGFIASPSTPAAPDELVACLGDVGQQMACAPAAVDACFDAIGGLCEQACALFPGCNIDAGGAECVDGCQQAVAEDPLFTDQSLRCIIAALRDQCDFEAFNRCIADQDGGGPPPPDPDVPPPPAPDEDRAP